MALPGILSLNDIVEIKVFCFAQDEQVGINVLHAQVVALTGVVGQADVAAKISGDVAPIYKALMPSAASFNLVTAKNLSQTPQPSPSEYRADAGPGTDGAILLPTQVCGIITLKTPFAGRKYRGRVYLPFPPYSENVSLDVPSAAYQLIAASYATYLKTSPHVVGGAGNADIRFGVYHKAKVGPPPVPQSIDAVTIAYTHAIWATQRRRGEYGRKNLLP